MSLSRSNMGRSTKFVALGSILALFAKLTLSVAAEDSGVPTVDSTIKGSLAHIITHDGKTISSGTGFCVGSHDGTAYILTNKHVVGGDPRPRVVLLSDPDSELYGRIDRLSTLDAAIIAVDNATCKPLALNADLPKVGAEIGIAGFPAFQLVIAADAVSAEPSFHAGSVSALPEHGEYIEYDAQTDRGNSGSPLFDAKSGVVIGLVTLVNTGTTGALQNNLSISAGALKSFLSNSHANVAMVGSEAPPTDSRPIVVPTGVTVAAAIDSRCGPGVAAGLYPLLSKGAGELGANDYSSAIRDETSVIETSSQCALKFYCPGSACDDTKYASMMVAELLAQQALRVAIARTNGDLVNAVRNELFSTTTLCDLPNIMTDGQPYSSIRDAMKVSLTLSRKIRATGPYRGIVDTQQVRDCATKLGV